MKKILLLLSFILLNGCTDDKVAPSAPVNNEPVNNNPVEEDQTWKIFTQTPGLPSNNVLAVAAAEDSTVWVGTVQGLSRFDGKTWKLYSNSVTGKPTDNINSLMYHNGILWIGTPSAGLLSYDGNQWLQYQTSNSSIPGNNIIAIDVDNANNVWVATSEGVGKYSNGIWSAFSLSSMQISSEITSISAATPYRIAIGTTQNGVVRLNGTQWETLPNHIHGTNTVLSVAQKDSVLWIGTDFKGLTRYTSGVYGTQFDVSNSVVPSNSIQLLKYDKDGRLWIGAGKGNILGGLVYNIGSTWKSYLLTNSQLPDNVVQAIDVDDRGYAWIGTRKGLARLKI